MSEEMSQQEWEDCWKGVTDCIDQEIINKIAEKSKNISIEDAREVLQEMEAREREREREAALDRLVEMDAELISKKDDE